MSLFQEVMVWKRLENGTARAVRYTCFQDVATGRYAVQSADFFHLPVPDDQLAFFARQQVELFIEMPVTGRCAWFDTLAEAIAAHDQDFN
ncbi:hypothetical protein [Azospirillum sp. B4]|uniref:hypothetical protein n=1 Tax=Azospirillum sp. B4 TaxID=95605 RepID=UPI0003463AEE|nr:hypothetical protein [Azospirillum sp. B4]